MGRKYWHFYTKPRLSQMISTVRSTQLIPSRYCSKKEDVGHSSHCFSTWSLQSGNTISTWILLPSLVWILYRQPRPQWMRWWDMREWMLMVLFLSSQNLCNYTMADIVWLLQVCGSEWPDKDLPPAANFRFSVETTQLSLQSCWKCHMIGTWHFDEVKCRILLLF